MGENDGTGTGSNPSDSGSSSGAAVPQVVQNGEVINPPTQVNHPWRTVVRSIFQGVIAFAIIAPLIYKAATNQSPEEATGWVAVGLGILSAVVRVMALPVVNDFIAKFLPVLSATPVVKVND